MVDVIIDRWETFTGNKAIKIGETKEVKKVSKPKTTTKKKAIKKK